MSKLSCPSGHKLKQKGMSFPAKNTIIVENTFGFSILYWYNLQCYWQVLQTSTDPDQQFSAPFKAGNSRQVQTCYKSMVQRQRKLQHFLVYSGTGETGVFMTLNHWASTQWRSPLLRAQTFSLLVMHKASAFCLSWVKQYCYHTIPVVRIHSQRSSELSLVHARNKRELTTNVKVLIVKKRSLLQEGLRCRPPGINFVRSKWCYCYLIGIIILGFQGLQVYNWIYKGNVRRSLYKYWTKAQSLEVRSKLVRRLFFAKT
jgi:hypothetical protein